MAGYARTNTADITASAVVKSAPINAELNAIVTAFAFSGGHNHDGTSTEGSYVSLIADVDALNKVAIDTTNNRVGFFTEVSSSAVEQIRIQDGAIVPVTDSDIDLGTASLEFKDLYLDGIAHVDTLDVDVNATVAGTLGVTGATTLGGILSIPDGSAGNPSITNTGDTNCGLFFSASDEIAFTAGGAAQVIFADGSITPQTDNDIDLGASDLEFKDLFLDGTAHIDTLDVDANAAVAGTLAVTGIATFTDDIIIGDGKTIGSASDVDAMTIASNGQVTFTQTLIGTALDISGAIDVDGTTNLDVVDIDGAVQIDATFTSGVDGQGYDTKFFGDTASAFMIWDTSADDLIFSGDAGLIVPDGQFTLGSTAVTSTAAELNALDGITAVVGELNALDIGSTAVGTAVASKAVILDSSKNYTGINNLTTAGNVVVGGNLTVNGTTTTVDTTNITIKDSLMELNSGASTGNDSGIIIQRGSTGNDALIMWDESADKWTLGTTTSTGTSTGNLNITTGTLVADLEGTASTATVATTVTITDNESTDEDNAIIFTAGGDVDGGNLGLESDGNLTYNPSTGKLSSTLVSGKIQTALIEFTDGDDAITIADGGGITANTSLTLASGSTVTAIQNQNNMAANSTSALATQASIKAYVDSVSAAANNVTGLTASGTELNVLDGASAGTIVNSKGVIYSSGGVVNATSLSIAGTALTATAAEFNLLDGGSTVGTTTVASGDGILTNDGTVMRQTNIDTFDTYLSATTKTLTNKTLTSPVLTSPKIVDGGFIADANGNEIIIFQTASSATNSLEITNSANGAAVVIGAAGSSDSNIDIDISPKGTGEVNIAASNLNYAGTAITATGAELNLTTGSSAGTIVNSKAVIYSSGGVVNATSLAIAGTALGATASEFNILKGGTSATGGTLADADRIIVNDDGTMVQETLASLKTYLTPLIQEEATALAIALG